MSRGVSRGNAPSMRPTFTCAGLPGVVSSSCHAGRVPPYHSPGPIELGLLDAEDRPRAGSTLIRGALQGLEEG